MRALSLVFALLLSTPAFAEGPDHPLHVNLEVDLPIFFGTAFTGAFFATGVISPDPAGYIPSSRDLNPLDRGALGSLRLDYSLASDIAWISMMALPMVDHLLESATASKKHGKHFGRRFGTDLVIYGEAMALNMLLTELIKFTAQRPRPLSYYDPADVQDGDLRADLMERQQRPDSAKSFLSGHTSGSFAAAATWSMLMTLKHPDRPVPVVLTWVATMAGASAVGVLRVEAGKHHPTDVIAGAALGTAIGILTPLAHQKKAPPVALVPMLDGEHRGAMVVGVLP